MEFTLHRNFTDLEALREEWNGLLHESINDVPFLRHEYLRTWWETRGGGEWPDSDLAVVVARQEGRLTGVAPLFAARNREGNPALLLLGSIEISDYLDLIVRPADLSAFVHGLLDFLGHSGPAGLSVPAPEAESKPWQVLDWQNIPEGSPTLPVLKSEADKHGWSFEQERTYHAPSIPLAGDFDTYLSGIDKKQRHEIRRKMRRAEEAGSEVRWYFAQDNATLGADVDAFMAMMAEEPDKAKFLTEAMRLQMQLSCRAAFENGWLQLAFLEVDGQKAAGYLNFDYLNHIWIYNSGIDRRFLELSPGWVLLGYLLQWANENKRLEFDFMRGNEEYKYRFGAVDHYLVRAKVTRPSHAS
jgi:CelD/BcsL family acetyltransferase involved in cellulose biosynthesis